MHTPLVPSDLAKEPAPDWQSCPWGRLTIHAARSTNSNMVGAAEFKYHGLRIRGVRIFHNQDGTLSVNMPQKQFGDTIESVCYFHEPAERAAFCHDVAWLFVHVFSRLLASREVAS